MGEVVYKNEIGRVEYFPEKDQSEISLNLAGLVPEDLRGRISGPIIMSLRGSGWSKFCNGKELVVKYFGRVDESELRRTEEVVRGEVKKVKEY